MSLLSNEAKIFEYLKLYEEKSKVKLKSEKEA